jgi:enoyl-CoA hydratase/carnithine racemase
MTDMLQIGRTGRVLRIALNRPEKRNALNAELCHTLVSAIEGGAKDAAVGAILLTGNGPSFCAGMDLTEIGQASSDRLDQAHEQLFTVGARLVKPLIAAVEGPALGGGTGLVANCHIVVASEQASFGLTEIRLGLWPFLVFRAVVMAVGERRAVEMALSGRIFDAKEAEKVGFVHEIAPKAVDRALQIAETVAAYSPTSIRSGMMFLQEARERSPRDAGDLARVVRREIFESDDFQEGIRAFREKRKPKWPSLAGVGDEM